MDEVLVKIWINGDTPSSKNTIRQTGGFFFYPKNVTEWKLKAYPEFYKQLPEFIEGIKDLSMPLLIRFTFYRGTKRTFDYVNIVQIVLDEMKKHKYIIDDDMRYVIPSFAPYKVEPGNPGVLIEVLKPIQG